MTTLSSVTAQLKHHYTTPNLQWITKQDCVVEFFIIKRPLRTSTVRKYLIRFLCTFSKLIVAFNFARGSFVLCPFPKFERTFRLPAINLIAVTATNAPNVHPALNVELLTT